MDPHWTHSLGELFELLDGRERFWAHLRTIATASGSWSKIGGFRFILVVVLGRGVDTACGLRSAVPTAADTAPPVLGVRFFRRRRFLHLKRTRRSNAARNLMTRPSMTLGSLLLHLVSELSVTFTLLLLPLSSLVLLL